MKYIKEILLTNKFSFNDNYDYVGFCSELNTYMLVITVPWIAHYSRYYWISEEDFNLAKNNLIEFKNKYQEAFDSIKGFPKGITFMGASALRDYDARKEFNLHISSGTTCTNVFQHYLYEKEDNILYAHILMNGIHYAVLPYRVIQNEKAEYVRALENKTNVEIVCGNINDERVGLFRGIKIDTFEGFKEWENEFNSKDINVNKELIENKGLPYSENLKMIPTTKNCFYPSKEYMFNMLTKYYLFATLAATNYDYDYFQYIYNNLNFLYKYDSFFNENDKILLNKLLNNDNSVNRFELSWLYEECFIFAWIMNFIDFPSQERENNGSVLNDLLFFSFDKVKQKKIPSKLFRYVYDYENKRLDFDKINLRSFDEILKEADLAKRYLWGLEELRINNKNNNSGLSESIIRHQVNAFSIALDWDLSNPGV